MCMSLSLFIFALHVIKRVCRALKYLVDGLQVVYTARNYSDLIIADIV